MGAPVLVLASNSPRRRALLAQIGVAFEVWANAGDDPPTPAGLGPEEQCQAAALAKARAGSAECPGRPVLGADTIVCLGERVLGKPADAAEAEAMLRELNGREHVVRTGVALVAPEGTGAGAGGGEIAEVRCAATQVRFRRLTDEQIRRYVGTGEPLDKAGAYGIQGRGAALVEGICGDYSNVVGLPIATVCEMLAQVGIVAP